MYGWRALALRARAWDRHGRGDAQSWQLPLARARGADVDYHGPLTTVAAIPGSPPYMVLVTKRLRDGMSHRNRFQRQPWSRRCEDFDGLALRPYSGGAQRSCIPAQVDQAR